MPKKIVDNKGIKEKLEYLGLDLENIPKTLTEFEPLEFRIPKFYDEKQYRQYRYISINDIQILLSPTNRLDELSQKYKKARPLYDYLDYENEENILNYTAFLKMLKEVKIEDIEKIEEEQNLLNKKIPYKVKFEGNYLWEIYYCENTDKYFMLVSTQDSDYSTFFFLLKKQLERKRTSKIFVPIKSVGYTNTYLKKSQFEDIENYLWLFTKDWPLIYEVFDKKNNLSIQIIGETQVYDKIKSPYKIKITDESDATKLYKLLKAMFILQTELPHYFKFNTSISNDGQIQFYIEDRKIDYEDIAQWIDEEYKYGEDKKEVVEQLIQESKEKLEKLKIDVSIKDLEYLSKEKQISTFLECKKTFFGKFKYYFKYSKKGNKTKIKKQLKQEEEKEENKTKKKKDKKVQKDLDKNYTIEELLKLYKEIESQESELKNLLMDINALKLKNKNLEKKIQNATLFIEEIDNHKKSIFEFWRYSNKDEISVLPKGEEEEINVVKKISKVFDYESDLEKFGIVMDKMQRKNLSKSETDSIYITTTDVIDILNKVKNNEVLPKEIENSLKALKKQEIQEKALIENDNFDIFGGIAQDSTRISKINQKKHRELPKDKFNILDISKMTKQIGYKLSLEQVISNIETALTKVVTPEDLPVYKALDNEKLEKNKINIFNINPEKEILENIKKYGNKINLYKINLKKGTNTISYTNCIFYDNKNKTLPIGQDLSTKILIDISKLMIKLKSTEGFKILEFENEKDDFSKFNVKSIKVFEYDIYEN